MATPLTTALLGEFATVTLVMAAEIGVGVHVPDDVDDEAAAVREGKHNDVDAMRKASLDRPKVGASMAKSLDTIFLSLFPPLFLSLSFFLFNHFQG